MISDYLMEIECYLIKTKYIIIKIFSNNRLKIYKNVLEIFFLNMRRYKLGILFYILTKNNFGLEYVFMF